MNHIIIKNRLLSSLSLCIFFGISNAAVAMNPETPTTEVKRNQYLRQAKAKTINYADEAESPVTKRKGKRERENVELNLPDKDCSQSKPRKSATLSRGYYPETNIPRLNLPGYRMDKECFDHYSFLQNNLKYRNKLHALAKAARK